MMFYSFGIDLLFVQFCPLRVKAKLQKRFQGERIVYCFFGVSMIGTGAGLYVTGMLFAPPYDTLSANFLLSGRVDVHNMAYVSSAPFVLV